MTNKPLIAAARARHSRAVGNAAFRVPNAPEGDGGSTGPIALPHWMKSVIGRFPRQLQQELRRVRYRRQLRSSIFFGDPEPECAHLGDWVAEGDWVADVGAHVGGYTVLLSQLVGESGRVLAFEPVPDTFELLAANLAFLELRNVSLFNVAVSVNSALMPLTIPLHRSGIPDFCFARLTSTSAVPYDPKANFNVFTLALDALVIPQRVTLVKVDVEGHELMALRGMEQLLRRDRPRLIVECATPDIYSFLGDFGYEGLHLPHSPNHVFSTNRVTHLRPLPSRFPNRLPGTHERRRSGRCGASRTR